MESIIDDNYQDIDDKIVSFLNKYVPIEDIKNVPKPSNLRISTRSAICKITRYIDIDKMVYILYNNIIKNIQNKEDISYPFIGIKYKNIDINFNNTKKKKNSIKKKKLNFYNQVTLIIKPHKNIRPQNIKLFKNSSISMTGGKNQNDGLCAVIKLLYEIKKYPSIFLNEDDRNKIYYKDFKITLINSDYYIQYNIDRLKLYNLLLKKYNMFVVYSPDIYSGVKIYFFWNSKNTTQDGICRCNEKCYSKKKNKQKKNGCKRVTIAVFQSGKIIITGANKISQTKEAYNIINKIITDNYYELRRVTIQDYDKSINNQSKKILKIKVKKVN